MIKEKNIKIDGFAADIKTMNIGEINKPSVDGQLVKPKYQVATTAPIESPKLIGDQIDISIKAKERFLQYNKKNKDKKKLNKEQKETESQQTQSNPHIDIIA